MEEEGAFGGFDELRFFLFQNARSARVFGLSVVALLISYLRISIFKAF